MTNDAAERMLGSALCVNLKISLKHRVIFRKSSAALLAIRPGSLHSNRLYNE